MWHGEVTMINVIRSLLLTGAAIVTCGCSSAAPKDISCSLGRELLLVEDDRLREARADLVARDDHPGAILALALMSEWRLGVPSFRIDYRSRWDALSGADRNLGTSMVLECARAGNGGAEMLLGIAYYTGIGVKPDLEAAMGYFGGGESTTERSSVGLIGAAAVAHRLGREQEVDALLDKVISRSIGFSEYTAGAAFYLGIIFEQDYVQAARWLRRAADKGDSRAQGTLGYMYALGRGVEQDDQQAQYWLERQGPVARSYEQTEIIIDGVSSRVDQPRGTP